MSPKLEQLLLKLQATLSEVLDASAEVSSVLEEVEREGLAVYVVIDNPQSKAEPEAWRLLPGVSGSEQRVEFRIDQTDLRILRDLGIDPTRTLRRGGRARRK